MKNTMMLIAYPSGEIVDVNRDIFIELQDSSDEFDELIRWDDEENIDGDGAWRFNDEDLQAVKELFQVA